MSDNKHNPTQRDSDILLPRAQPPLAIMTIVLDHGLNVSVNVQGPPSRFLLGGMLREAGLKIDEEIAKASKGPQVALAPPGLKL